METMLMAQSQADLDNHANQLNDNNDEYWNSRGEDRPEDDNDEEEYYDCYIDFDED